MKYVDGKIRFCPICKKNILECQCNVEIENNQNIDLEKQRQNDLTQNNIVE